MRRLMSPRHFKAPRCALALDACQHITLPPRLLSARLFSLTLICRLRCMFFVAVAMARQCRQRYLDHAAFDACHTLMLRHSTLLLRHMPCCRCRCRTILRRLIMCQHARWHAARYATMMCYTLICCRYFATPLAAYAIRHCVRCRLLFAIRHAATRRY